MSPRRACSDLPPEAFAAALAALPGIGPVGLMERLGRDQPQRAWERAGVGRRPRPGVEGVASGWAALQKAGVGVTVLGYPGYPAALADDHEAPAVLFWRGDLSALEGRRVGIVGSRNCTRYGRDVAFEMGRDLAANGVRIVSGLALGIDGAAHAGALAAAGGAPPLAVVGSGLDVVYPKRHAALWQQVATAGALLSEAPLGAPPEAWRFPVRNRIIAALAEVVVVVESLHRGGSRHTVEAAMARDRPILAVPGPVRSPTSGLPNALLADGCHPARDATDVLVALNLCPGPRASAAGPAADRRPPPDAAGAAVLDAFGWQAATFEQLVLATGRSPGEVGLVLAHLERDGWITGGGGWWERAATG